MVNQTESSAKVALIAKLLTDRGMTLGLAESCTGGLLGHLITEYAGASNFFAGSIVSYSNEVKRRVLGVSAATLDEFGAVSAETVSEMAKGALEKLGCDVAAAISGIAGPAGGSTVKPVGTVFIGFASKQGTFTYHFQFIGTRSEIKALAANKALDIIVREIDT